MKRSIYTLILIIFVLSACSTEKNTGKLREVQGNTIESNSTIQPGKDISINSAEPMENSGAAMNGAQSQAQNKQQYSLKQLSNLIGRDKQSILEELGADYQKVQMGVTGKDSGYFFENTGLALYFNGNGRLQYIEMGTGSKHLDFRTGNNFDSIRRNLSCDEVESYEIRDDGYLHENYYDRPNLYMLTFKSGDSVVKFFSEQITGENYKILLYRPAAFVDIAAIVKLLGYDFSKVVNLYGQDYLISGEYDEAFPWWKHYEALGLYFGNYSDSEDNSKYIEIDKNVLLNKIKPGMTFNEIMKVMGKTRIFEEERYMMEYRRYVIKYVFDTYFIEASSDDKEGTNSQIQIGMENPELEARIFDNLDWEFSGNGIWLIYDNKKYLVRESDMTIFPVYLESEYTWLNIPKDAIGACRQSITGPGELEAFYVKKADNELVLYEKIYEEGKADNEIPFKEYLRIKID
ncbi:hypothetical protein CLHUN_27580 [Ruminiclostridium hungatei]|uniref:Uncharacterized protein n=1 Tax=Ruminiclostridium hungatei TaxID=48256 RepID=A0A1V4SI27_RUMHU|nr:hypothetical protein [Ruminiclostridium hungatei]OPX43413.1 hypothetical protein CLHUN_27580 [Ruminiclostridium hungatei]